MDTPSAPDHEPVILAVRRLLAGYPGVWAVCGGWAIDLFLGHATRLHEDVDVAVARADQAALQRHFVDAGWMLHIAHQGQLTPWQQGEWVELPRHSIWATKKDYQPDLIELLLNEIEGNEFCFRRDRSTRLPLEQAILHTAGGTPFLAPELLLLYKAGHTQLEKNALDFLLLLPHLGDGRRRWLAEALIRLDPAHEWLPLL